MHQKLGKKKTTNNPSNNLALIEALSTQVLFPAKQKKANDVLRKVKVKS